MSPFTARRMALAFAFLLTAGAASATTATPPAPPSPPPPPAAKIEPPPAPTREARQVAACKSHALALLQPRSPAIDDIFIDMDGLTIAGADMKVGGARITSVIMGEAYIQRDRTDRPHRFLCLTGEDDAVLLTFFTER